MSRPKALPDDVRQTCIQLVRGYDRRVRDYYDRRKEIIEGTSCRHEVIRDRDHPGDWEKEVWAYTPAAHNASRTTEGIAERLIGLEELAETKRMRAVEQAKACIGLDLPGELRQKLERAIILNCKAGRRYPYEYLDVDGVGRTDFYARRMEFLADIARYLELI